MSERSPVRKPDNKKVRINPFTAGWWLYLGAAFLLPLVFRAVLKDSPREVRLHFLFVFSLFQLIYLMIYKWSLRFYRYNFTMWNELPFYLCNMSTLVSIIASGWDVHFLQCFCVTVGTIGTLLAFLMPDGPNVDLAFFSFNTLGFYGYHALLLATCLSYHVLGICAVEFSDIPMILLAALSCICLAHLVNTLLRKSVLPSANYIFTYTPDNVILSAVYKKIPIPLVYLFPLLIPGAVLTAILILILRIR
ncbi:MAG: YwaF family protein [Erysipelotrichaceae bacterium]|nr:YwaF family protein [Erysipelotrichaceae bacterium]